VLAQHIATHTLEQESAEKAFHEKHQESCKALKAETLSLRAEYETYYEETEVHSREAVRVTTSIDWSSRRLDGAHVPITTTLTCLLSHFLFSL